MSDKRLILAVDDEPLALEAVLLILKAGGFETAGASTGAECLAAVRELQPDVVLLDVHLPDMSGLEVCRRIKEDPASSHILVIHLSATFTSSEMQSAALEAGADGYIAQPVDPRELIARIRAALRLREVDEALRSKSEELDRFFSLALDLLCIADTDGYFRRLNRSWEATLGYRIEDLEGRMFLDFVHPDDLASTLDAVASLGKGHSVINFINRYRCADGSYRWLEWRSMPYEQKLVYAAARDITERIRMEEKVRQAELLATVAQLAQGLAHEVRNPLFALQVNASVILRMAQNNEAVAPYAKNVDDQVRRLDHLMRDILELGHPLIPESFVQCSLADLLAQMRLDLLPEDPAVVDRLSILVPTGLPLVKAVPGKLAQAFMHLTLNALQNSPPEGAVRVTVKAGDGGMLVHVADEGSGIADKVKDRMFEPFVTTRAGHRGLGLALAMHYVRAHGGTITAANNDPPPGATFTVFLPPPGRG